MEPLIDSNHDKNEYQGWIIPPQKEPAKSKEKFIMEREEKVKWLISQGFLRSERIKDAMLKVPREEFIPPLLEL